MGDARNLLLNLPLFDDGASDRAGGIPIIRKAKGAYVPNSRF